MDDFRNTKAVAGARELRVTFNADTADSMPWKFKPLQREVRIVPGEPCLVFFNAKNPTDKAVTGVSTYNVTPMKAGVYFNKIQCFCFEEQRLRPHEDVDMPILFYVDPAFLDDPMMKNVRTLCLSYCFFKRGEDDDDEEED